MQQSNKSFSIFHFNDVYEIEASSIEPVGGAARFVTEVKKFREMTGDQGLVLFSGDLFSPSTLSVLYKGEQMIEPINACSIDAACVGNHEFDYSLPVIEGLFSKCNFPWLCSNIFNNKTQNILANNHAYYIEEKGGIKIGVMGLAEEDWLETITEIDMSIVHYEAFSKCGKDLAHYLKDSLGCDLIIALTHMRVPNDRKLSMEVPEIDIILGGHDHIVICEKSNESLFIKSGSDFKDYGILKVEQGNFQEIQAEERQELEKKQTFIIKNKFKISANFQKVTKDIPEDEHIRQHVESYVEKSKAEMQKVVGYTSEPLDTRFSELRTQETNFANFYTDVIRKEVQSDIVLINSGTIRSDCIFPSGPIDYATLKKALPFPDIIIVQELTGEQVIQALENGVSKYPAFEGRFPMVSGIRFTFDARQPPGSRIVRDSVFVGDALIDVNKMYSSATKWFVSLGKDGYDMFVGKRYLLDYENGLPHLQIMISFFKSLESSVPGKHIKLKPKTETHKEKKSLSMLIFKNLQEIKQIGEHNLFEIQQNHHQDILEPLPPLEFKKSFSSIVSKISPSLAKLNFMRQYQKKDSRIEKIEKSNLVAGIKLQDDHPMIVIAPILDGRIKIIK